MTPPRRRHALALGYANGALWSIGNGLSTGTSIYYLAQQLGAQGTALSLLIAAPSLIGLLRLATPALLRPLGGIKATCLKTSLLSYLLLATGLPTILLAPGLARATALAAMIALICIHQLFEYIGSVALWSWYSKLVPPRLRGRYFARRQVWQLATLIPTLLASGFFLDYWKKAHLQADPQRVLVGYVLVSGLGGIVLLLSLIPLALMPDVELPPPAGRAKRTWPTIDLPFARLLVYRCWFSFFNGLTQAAQNVYVYTLGIGVLPMQIMQIGMRGGQMALAPAVGRASDRFGNRPVLEVSQLAVAAGLFFFVLAAPAESWWIVGAYVCWSAYAGLNICLTNIMLKLAPPRENSAHIALFEALGGIAYGLTTIAGGLLLDHLRAADFHTALLGRGWDAFALVFLLGTIARALGVLWLARIPEPGARTWRAILQRQPTPATAVSAHSAGDQPG